MINNSPKQIIELTNAMASAMNLILATQYIRSIPKLPGVRYSSELEQAIKEAITVIANSTCVDKTARILEGYKSDVPAAKEVLNEMCIYLNL